MSDDAKAVHTTMGKAYDLLLACRVALSGISPDTAFAIGEAAGAIAKAKALAGRDIDQAALAEVVQPRKRKSRAKSETANSAVPAGDLLRQ